MADDALIYAAGFGKRANAYTDAQIELVRRLIKPADISLQGIKEITLAGKGPEFFQIGDYFEDDWTATDGTVYAQRWDCVAFRDVEKENGDIVRNAPIWMTHWATVDSVQFDANEGVECVAGTDTVAVEGIYYYGSSDGTRSEDVLTLLELEVGAELPYSDYNKIYKAVIRDTTKKIIQYGYNRWSHSAYRQYLNADALKNNWWTAQHDLDVAPSQHGTVNGFLYGCTADFKAAVGAIKIQTCANTVTDAGATDITYDKVWLPSVEEMYGVPQSGVAGKEGAYFPYIKEATGLSAPSNSENAGRIKYGLNAKTSAQFCRLRSSYRGGTGVTWHLYTSGTLGGYGAYSSYRCAPACVFC